ncbi:MULTISPECIES: beta-galactosidase GalB [unclassified Lentimonas]|uniref:beta-galactosidase GalB n=1 Tax=unclassified Lentimonas TaxID=2630993 RepID=UPI0013284DD2|nr:MULTISPECIES: beta-galactosidase GalB [unclassified Lentimonas]CAA6692393.1 Beta-galactosidase (EC [Lentimonas sp. CC19]CAA6693963.1 Beta-galactosidase (EC [Lentimonas sp. CC10]CAA7072211.1 Beta-galactosidase (EC [Lentimonas sp. CC11]
MIQPKHFLIALCALASLSSIARETLSLNDDWKFARFGDMPDGSQLEEPKGLEHPSFDDSSWRSLNVPHDWGIEGPFRAELPNRTGKLPWSGIGWYRKHFDSPASDAGKKVFIDFDGSMSGNSIYLNGAHIGDWPYGYSSFRMELTDHIKIGQQNVLAVRLNNQAESSRWYPGGGIYRSVRMVKTEPVHVAHWGVYITTPIVSTDEATVKIETTLDGDSSNATITHEITEDGSDTVLASGTGKLAFIKLSAPKLWDLQTPNLYTVNTSITIDGKVVDTYKSTFGVRTIKYTTGEGFLLNGKVVRMNGVCQHHDLGPLGAAVNVRAIERQIEILKGFGVNAIRTSHNPPAPEFLELCDRMGILVQVESFDAWSRKKADNDYAQFFWEWWERDTINMVRRDRNHPCVVMWSTGNEILEMSHPEEAWISQMQTDLIKKEDPTRPVSFGGSRPEAAFNGFQNTIDVYGFNYKPHLYAKFREANPDIPLYSSESASTVSSRGEYFFPVSDDKFKGQGGYFQVSSYDLTAPNWAYRPDIEFEAQDKYPWVFGEFVWTGFDYIGEPTPYNKDKTNLLNFTDPAERERMKKELAKLGGDIPPRSSYFGIVDLCGFPKDRYYMYQARWRPELPLAHILPHWNWPERVGEITPVHVYTSGDEAELFLNGKSLGRKIKGEFEYRLRWDDVIYEPGELVVVAYKNGNEWVKNSVQTTGEATQLALTVDRSVIAADGQDLAFITVDVVDSKGRLVPRTHNSVKYKITGPGIIAATGNGDPTSHESFQATERKVFNGKALVVVRSIKGKKGTVTLTAESDGLTTAETTIRIK